MKKAEYNLTPKTINKLKIMGEQIKLARLRRNLSVKLVSERAGFSRATLWKIESGDPSVGIGFYASCLCALNGLDDELLKICKDDELGRLIQDLNLPNRKRASKKQKH